MRRRARAAGALLAALATLRCASLGPLEESGLAYRPDRRDYWAFRAAWPELLEPNYLPFMVHRFSARDPQGDLLVLCRWPDEAMPLGVYVRTPQLPEELQDEFNPREPARYVEAVEEALARWERELEGLVRFRRVDARADAQLALRLVAERGPREDAERQALGLTRLRGSCRPRGWDPDAQRLRVEFEVPEIRIYLADAFGLLTADQVEWIALHEIGHALGMRGHSPLRGDLMYEVVRDRVRVPELSLLDVNSFVSLYQLPSGTVFGRVPPLSESRSAPPLPPAAEPQLALAPHVDSRRGFEIRPPHGWTRIETARGLAMVHGVAWDYSASIQVIVERYATVEEYLGRYLPAYLSHGRVLQTGWIAVNGHRALHATIEGAGAAFVEDLVFVESGDGRLLVVIADCPAEHAEAYRPWFWATLGTLDIRRLGPR